jgi:integrase
MHAIIITELRDRVLNILPYCNRYAQVCVSDKKAKNLATATETKTVAGDKRTYDINGYVTQFLAWLEKEGYSENKYTNNLRTVHNWGANILDPEDVKRVIGKQQIKNGSKLQYVYTYTAFCKMQRIQWELPRYKAEETLPYVPEENELNALIYASRSKRMTAYLQLLKETWVDPGEAIGLRWIDISGNIVTINRPVKGHNPRQLQISNKLLAMLNELPKTTERIFPTTYNALFACYSKIRKRAAFLQKNPRLLLIQLRSFRHWGGTMLAHYTNGNLLTVKRLLGHKRIENTMKYVSMINNFQDNEFEIATATTDEEIKKIGAV